MRLRALKTFRDSSTRPATPRKPGDEFDVPDGYGRGLISGSRPKAIEMPAGGPVAAAAGKAAGGAPGARPSRPGRTGGANRRSSSAAGQAPSKRKRN